MTINSHPPCGWTVATAAGPQVVFCRADDNSAAAAEAMAWDAFGAPVIAVGDVVAGDEPTER